MPKVKRMPTCLPEILVGRPPLSQCRYLLFGACLWAGIGDTWAVFLRKVMQDVVWAILGCRKKISCALLIGLSSQIRSDLLTNVKLKCSPRVAPSSVPYFLFVQSACALQCLDFWMPMLWLLWWCLSWN